MAAKGAVTGAGGHLPPRRRLGRWAVLLGVLGRLPVPVLENRGGKSLDRFPRQLFRATACVDAIAVASAAIPTASPRASFASGRVLVQDAGFAGPPPSFEAGVRLETGERRRTRCGWVCPRVREVVDTAEL